MVYFLPREMPVRAIRQESEKIVGDVMSPVPMAVAPDTDPRWAEDIAKMNDICHLLVISGQQLVGVVCVCDLWWATHRTHVGDLMSTPVLTTAPDVTLVNACHKMQLKDVGCLPVMAGDNVCGVVTRGDAIRTGQPEISALNRLCVSCGSHHHVRRVAYSEQPVLCLRCITNKNPDEIEHVLTMVT